jgi:hypothetical protein
MGEKVGKALIYDSSVKISNRRERKGRREKGEGHDGVGSKKGASS